MQWGGELSLQQQEAGRKAVQRKQLLKTPQATSPLAESEEVCGREGKCV